MAFAFQKQHLSGSQAGSTPQRAAARKQQPCLQLQVMTALRQQQQQQHHVCRAAAAVMRPLEVSCSIAAARAAESTRPDALFQDPYAAALCGQQQATNNNSSSRQAAMDVVATQYIDESLHNAMDAHSINSIQEGDYRQVVLLGDGFDTRPFRLSWPPGTLLFAVAPAEVHEQAEALLAGSQPPAHVQRGCLLRRVNMNLKPAVTAAGTAAADAAAAKADRPSADSTNISSNGSSGSAAGGETTAAQWDPDVLLQQGSPPTVFREQLSRAGFRADRLSVWVLQGLHDQGVGPDILRQLLAEVADSAAFHSLLVGELPGPLSRQDADNLLAEAGLLGAVYDYATADGGQYKRWEQHDTAAADGQQEGTAADLAPRWMCTGQQLRLSLAQMGIYDEWSTEFEEADFGDDVIGNVS